MLALSIGTLLAVGALAYVLFPLFVQRDYSLPPRQRAPRGNAPAAEHEAVVALREIEFDRVTGKLSDTDYAELRERYTKRALAAMRAGDASAAAGEAFAAGTPASTTTPADAAEAAVRAYRARVHECARCGPRPEPDAVYCSTCGLFLPGACNECGSAITEAGATFCHSCGRRLAA